ncbi:S41 family peptidase [Parabacteroides pacaensis]|uniref:S41 family peptidase n=1 Tax=Parabacteroides pacaensis TaxID=2086575 RepID=UPI00131B67F4|nr:S41 family peptidase [Parabacteroides pacaensis]
MNEVRKGYSWENNPLTNEAFINSSLSSYLSSYEIEPPYYVHLKNIHTGKTRLDTILTQKIQVKDKPTFQFKFYPQDSIAVLFYNICRIPKGQANFIEETIIEEFKNIEKQNIRYLFIDVRTNEGGSSEVHDYIFKRLKTKKYKRTSYAQVNTQRIQSDVEKAQIRNQGYLEKYGTNFWKRHQIKRLIKKLNKKIPAILSTGISKKTEIIPANHKGFKGKIFILQSRETFSATISFCEEIKRRKMGLLVGEETGEPITFAGNVEYAFLPHSKILFSYPHLYSWIEPKILITHGFIQPDIRYDVFRKTLDIQDYKKIIQLSNTLK